MPSLIQVLSTIAPSDAVLAVVLLLFREVHVKVNVPSMLNPMY
jgi:hypothetical protein